MLELVIVACLSGADASCLLVTLARFERPEACAILAAPLVTQYASQHPESRIVAVTCREPLLDA